MTFSRPDPALLDDTVIDIDHLVVRYGARRAVNGLTLRVARGSVFGLLGPNGSGKTTTIKTLLGFRSPTSGSARVLGYDIRHHRQEINARIGFVSETNSLYLGMTIDELLSFCRATARQWNDSAVHRYLHLFGLPTKARVRQLSKGMRTQLALCVALASEPELLILDEPMTGLDPIARHAFLKVLMEEVAPAGKTIFFSTHILSDVETVADHVSMLRAGQVVVSQNLDELKQQHATAVVSYANPLEDEQLHTLQRIPGMRSMEREGRSVRLRLEGDIDTAVAALRATSPAPISVDVTHLTLEEIFLQVMEQGEV